VLHGYVDIMRVLIEAGANLEVRDDMQSTSLYLAVTVSLEAVELLLNAGADPNTKVWGQTALCRISSQVPPSAEQLAFVADQMADTLAMLPPDMRITPPESPTVDPEPIISLLVSRGADVREADDGLTSLHCAVQAGSIRAAKCLIRLGADLDRANDEGLTPRQMIKVKQDPEWLSLLL
jgi:ankyrin repeat protein